MITEISLLPQLAREMGDTDTSNLYFSANQLFSAINDAIKALSTDSPNQQYSVIGSGNTAYFSPDPSTEDQYLIVLYASLCLTNGEIQKASRVAYSHSNPAGSTNLINIPKMLMLQADRIQDKITAILQTRSMQLAETDTDNGMQGIELKGRPTEVTEGLGITTIEHTV